MPEVTKPNQDVTVSTHCRSQFKTFDQLLKGYKWGINMKLWAGFCNMEQLHSAKKSPKFPECLRRVTMSLSTEQSLASSSSSSLCSTLCSRILCPMSMEKRMMGVKSEAKAAGTNVCSSVKHDTALSWSLRIYSLLWFSWINEKSNPILNSVPLVINIHYGVSQKTLWKQIKTHPSTLLGGT